MQGLATGLLALPNLFIRSLAVLTFLYGVLGLVLITLVQFNFFGPGIAVIIGVSIAGLQFALGPWLMDLTLTWVYRFRWSHPTFPITCTNSSSASARRSECATRASA
jgi:hypothetical protein